MSPRDFGYIATFVALANVFSIPTTSAERLLLREASRPESRQDAAGWTLRYLLVAAAATLVLGAIVGAVLEAISAPLPFTLAPLAALTGAAMGCLRSSQALHRADNDFFRGQVPNELLRPTLILAGIGVVAVAYGDRLSFNSVVMVYVIGAVVPLVWVAPHFWKDRRATPTASVRLALRTSLKWFGGTTALTLLSDRAVEVLIGFLDPGEPAGVIGLALRLASLSVFGLMLGQFLYAPTLAANNDRSMEKHVVHRVRLLSNLFSYMFSVPLLIAPNLALRLLAPEYEGYETVVRLVAVAGIVNALTGPSQIVLEMRGKEQIVTASFAISLCVNVPVGLVMIPQHSAIGAAITFLLAITIREIYLTIACYQRCDIWVGPATLGHVLGLRAAHS